MSKKGRSDGDLRPRAEAGPVPHAELTVSQKQTARQVLQLLAGMARATMQFEPYDQDLIRIDPIRHNRTILIDGARGSGKTTLLISLLDVLQRHFGQRTDPRHPNHKVPDDGDWAELLKANTDDALIVPVSLVDLAPLPRRSSLMLLLISCLETIVKRMEFASHGVSPEQRAQARLAPFCYDGERLLISRERWNELAAATVQGWDDHAAKRTPPSDMESYAQEAMTAEQQRLDISNLIDRFLTALQDDFRTYLRQVSTDKQRSRMDKQEPVLFLIAIDDADMNPGRVAELLDVLRLLGHRQLAFLLTGDSELFQDTLYKSCLIALAGERLAATDASLQLRARAEPLAHQIYDKLVPPSHRFVIEPIPRNQRLAVPVLPLGSADAHTSPEPGEQKERTLKLVLEKYTPRIGEILTHCPFLLDVLPGHMRRLQNLLLAVERLAVNHSEVTHRESALVQWLWQTIAQEAGRTMTRERLGDVASDSDVLRVSLRSSFANLGLQPATNREPGPRSEEALVRQIYFPELQLPETDQLGREQALVAALTLAAVTALLQENGAVKQLDALTRAPKEQPLVQVQIVLPETLTLGWPISAQLSLHEQVVLAYYFAHRGLAKKDSVELATGYLHLVCTMRKLLATPGKTLPQVPPQTELSVAEVARQIHLTARSQKAGQTTAERSVQTWARLGAALLCAPEYGLPAKLANELLFELRRRFGETEWPVLRAELAQARRARVVAALPDQEDEDSPNDPSAAPLRARAEDRILSLIDQQLPDYDFRLLVEDIEAGTVRKALLSANLTVSDATLLLLDQGSADWLRLLLKGLATLAPQRPEDRQLVTALRPAWQATGRADSYGYLLDASAFARLSEESPDKVLLRLRAALMSDRLPRGELMAQGRTDATALPITVSLAALPTFRRVEGQLSPLQEGILHLLWDEPLAAAKAPPLTSTHEWPAVSVRIDSAIDQIDLPWLSALFRTFAAAGAVTETWNQAIAILRRPEHRRADSGLLDRLAFFYLRCCLAAATATPLPTSLPEKDLLYRDFGQLLKQVAQTVAQSSETQQEARSGIVTAELWEEVILLAVPESGLSFEGVRSIILFLQEQDADHYQLWSALQRRKDRLSALIWNERDAARRTRQESQAAAERLLEYVEKIARNVGHPFQVWIDTNPKLQAVLKSQ